MSIAKKIEELLKDELRPENIKTVIITSITITQSNLQNSKISSAKMLTIFLYLCVRLFSSEVSNKVKEDYE